MSTIKFGHKVLCGELIFKIAINVYSRTESISNVIDLIEAKFKLNLFYDFNKRRTAITTELGN